MEFDYESHRFRSEEFAGVVDEAIEFMNKTPVHLLPPDASFAGSGVYALYYVGSLSLYQGLARRNLGRLSLPIYVGKAVPAGWRTARVSGSSSFPLYRRLTEHARSIEQADSLSLCDFRCRVVILTDIEGDLVVPVEAEIIRRYRPLWNTVVDGFGNHDPGSGRYNQAPSEWDTLHPGRAWVENLTGNPPELHDIVAKIRQVLG